MAYRSRSSGYSADRFSGLRRSGGPSHAHWCERLMWHLTFDCSFSRPMSSSAREPRRPRSFRCVSGATVGMAARACPGFPAVPLFRWPRRPMCPSREPSKRRLKADFVNFDPSDIFPQGRSRGYSMKQKRRTRRQREVLNLSPRRGHPHHAELPHSVTLGERAEPQSSHIATQLRPRIQNDVKRHAQQRVDQAAHR